MNVWVWVSAISLELNAIAPKKAAKSDGLCFGWCVKRSSYYIDRSLLVSYRSVKTGKY